MSIISKILDHPFMWDLSQMIFGCNAQKKRIYSSFVQNKGKLLDFGCADGNTFEAFKDFEYYGVDINKKLIDYALKRYSSYRNAHFICADILDNTFQQGFFDSVLFAVTGHHIPDEQFLKITAGLSRVLKPGGSLYFFDTIRDKKRKSWLLNFLINMDQGQHMRDHEAYQKMIHDFSKDLIPVEEKVFVIKGAFMPQPTYFYAELKKK